MDRKRFKPEADSNYMINQCGTTTRLDDGVDRISSLPDDIIVVILSFLSLKEAAATSVLSSRWLHLWKHTPNPNSDRLSRLPHSVIVDILSLLPLRTAVATSVLCSRWPNMWKHTTSLGFSTYKQRKHAIEENMYMAMMYMAMMRKRGSWDAERCEYIQLVNSVIKSHKAPSLKRFAISLCLTQSAKCIAAKWLQFAFSRGVERLFLDFKCTMTRHMVVLEELLRESGLCSSPQTLILFKSLKKLYLKHVKVSGDAVKIFLRNCPLLKVLIICDSYMTSDIEVCGATLALRHLEVLDCCGEKSLRVSAPNLTRLKFSDTLGKLFLESVPKLVEAGFRFHIQRIDVVQNVASALFRLSSQLEILKLSLRWPKVFLANEFAEMPKLRKLVVGYTGVKTHSFLPVTALLWASPILQEFKLKFDEIQNGDAAIGARRNGERCRHPHLKLFELTGHVHGAVGHIELVNYISNNCVGLEKINIFLGASPFSLIHWGSFESLTHKDADRNYAEQRLQGKLPQHIQLQIIDSFIGG